MELLKIFKDVSFFYNLTFIVVLSLDRVIIFFFVLFVLMMFDILNILIRKIKMYMY